MDNIRNNPTGWLLIPDVQEYVAQKGRHWSRAYIYTLLKTEKLKSFKFGGTRVILQDDVDTLLSALKRPAPPYRWIKEVRASG